MRESKPKISLKENNDKEKHMRIKHKMNDGGKHKKVIIKQIYRGKRRK